MILDHSSIMLSVIGCNIVREETLFPIVRTCSLRRSLRSGQGKVCVTLTDAAHVPSLSHHLLSLRSIADARNKYIGTRQGIRTVFAKSSVELISFLYGQLNNIFVTALACPVKRKHMP